MESQGEGYPNVADRTGWTTVHSAASIGSAESLKTLIESGADVNAATKNFSPRKRKRSEDCGVLEELDLTARPFNFIEKSITPLHLAALENHLECVRLLLDHGANVSAVDSKGQNPLYLAAREGHPECVMMMLQSSGSCPDVLTPTHTQDTALLQCILHGDKMRDCIKELVYRGADVGHRNRDGDSAVHKAVDYNWDMDMMKLLILEGRGVDFDRTEEGSPLRSMMNRQVFHYGNGRGTNPPLFTNEDGNTAMFFIRMGMTRKELKKLLWYELNLPKPAGDLLLTLMDSFSHLPSLLELETEIALGPPFIQSMDQIFNIVPENGWFCSGTLWHCLEASMTEEARRQEEERLKAIVAEKKRYYLQRRTEGPSLAHLNRAAIRSNLQADVRKVISWPVPQCVKRYILLDHVL